MGTPTFTNFSRSSGAVSRTVQRIEEYICQPWNCQLDGFALLQVSDDPYEGGYEMVGDLATPCTEYGDVTHLIDGRNPFGIVYYVRDIPSYFYVHFTEIEDEGHTVTIDMETTMVYRRDDEHPKNGEWIQAWLTSMAFAVDADVCAYGNRDVYEGPYTKEEIYEALRRPRYEALKPEIVLDELRHERLLEYPDPVFHAIRYELANPFEIRRLMEERPKADGLVYKIAPGYHILSNIVCP